MKIINNFENEYAFLSNFYDSPFKGGDGIIYPTNEHFFQAMKSHNQHNRELIAKASTPGQAKRLGRQLVLRADWESIKDDVMRNGLANKFDQNPKLLQKLLDTEDAILIEGNNWHDNTWGNCYCEKCCGFPGENRLGKMLMELRKARGGK